MNELSSQEWYQWSRWNHSSGTSGTTKVGPVEQVGPVVLEQLWFRNPYGAGGASGAGAAMVLVVPAQVGLVGPTSGSCVASPRG